MGYIQESLFGKTYAEPIPATEARTSAPYCKPFAKSQTPMPMCLDLRKGNGAEQAASWGTGTLWLGEPTTLSIGECPSAAVESTLSQILEANAPEKYFLSRKACAGILRRAIRRGKQLPYMLLEAIAEALL